VPKAELVSQTQNVFPTPIVEVLIRQGVLSDLRGSGYEVQSLAPFLIPEDDAPIPASYASPSRPPSRKAGHVFISYAAEDRKYIEEFVKVLRAAKVPMKWDQNLQESGNSFEPKLEKWMSEARVAIFFVSNSLLDKDKKAFIWEREVGPLRARMGNGLDLYTILVEPCPLNQHPELSALTLIANKTDVLSAMPLNRRKALYNHLILNTLIPQYFSDGADGGDQ